MALNYTRLFCKQNVNFSYLRNLKMVCSPMSVTIVKPFHMTNVVNETHDERNMRLGRPMSPHLTIYQPQLTSGLSLTHRTTGMILAACAITLGTGTLISPDAMPNLISFIDSWSLPSPLIFLGKYIFAFCATFHTFNGIRHLAWDMGKFLTLPQVYQTGYIALGLSVITALILAAQ
ncbi:succinate dehydrogenase cytochrome b560 subunit, mitochondrial-like [Prorops nasuta]|uniref:succinate dehydrogenase cytochrome b560 subunit, mitochondrial-like n=1 Tax=Prorops nasuta TaxID=863751 RepID=UPI0034CD2475